MRRLALISSLIFALYLPSAFALDAPKGPVVLTLNGDFPNTNAPNQAQFDMAMLSALPQTSFETRTPWAKTPHVYTGFSATDLLKLVGSHGSLLHITALNQYVIDIPISDFAKRGAIFAIKEDGKPISIRDLGPIMVIYPFDGHPALQNETYYWRSIWQARDIDVIAD